MSVQLGKRIRGLRRLKGLTQQKLAYELNVSVSFLSNIERGIKKPQPDLLEKLAQTLSVPGDELFFFPDKEQKTASM